VLVIDFVYYNCKLNKEAPLRRNREWRLRTPVTLKAFKENVSRCNWESVYVNDANEAYSSFLNIYLKLYETNCPLKMYIEKKREQKPWMTKGLLNACKKKNTLYRVFLKQRTEKAEIKYKAYKNKLTKILRLRKETYYSSCLEENKGNMKGTWKIINGLIRKKVNEDAYPKFIIKDNRCIDKKQDVAEEFNDFFVNVGLNLARDIVEPKEKNGLDELIENNLQSLYLSEVCESEVRGTVLNCKSKRSQDCNKIDMSLVKETIEEIIKPLTHVCNVSFRTGIFPDQMKVAKVIPLFKAGNKNDLSNYRPVSLLPQFSKILEKRFVKRLDRFINKYNILIEQQYGFQAKHRLNKRFLFVITLCPIY